MATRGSKTIIGGTRLLEFMVSDMTRLLEFMTILQTKLIRECFYFHYLPKLHVCIGFKDSIVCVQQTPTIYSLDGGRAVSIGVDWNHYPIMISLRQSATPPSGVALTQGTDTDDHVMNRFKNLFWHLTRDFCGGPLKWPKECTFLSSSIFNNLKTEYSFGK